MEIVDWAKEVEKVNAKKLSNILEDNKKIAIANSYLEKEKDKQKFYTIIYRAIAVAEAVVLIIVLAK